MAMQLGNDLVTADETIDLLIRLGLTVNQTKVILALDRIGRCATVNEIAAYSKVAREKVYCVMPQLQEIGLVEKILTVPVEFKAIPLSNITSILIEKRLNETDEIRRKTRELLLANIKEEKLKQNSDEESIVLCNKQIGQKKRMEAFENATESLDVLTLGFDLEDDWSYYLRKYKKVLKRNGQIRLILQQPIETKRAKEGLTYLARNPLFHCRYAECVSPGMSLYIIDRKQVTIATSTKDFPRKYSVICGRNPVLVSLTRGYFETVWNQAGPLIKLES